MTSRRRHDDDMGKHVMTLANGYQHEADLHPAPLTALDALQVRQGGSVSPWPRQEDTSDSDKNEHWWRHFLAATRRVVVHRAWLAAVPVVLVNAVAFAGQLAFLRGHLPWTPAGQVLVAVTLESVAVYLAWHAHLALAADDSALRLRLAAYSFAAVIGVMNYSHYMAPHWRPTFAAVTFGLMSVSSPWLWSVHSRRVSRDSLRARGLIEPHAVRLGATRWTWHPWRSAKVMWHATWIAENDPAKAIALVAKAPPASDGAPAAGDMDQRQGDDGTSDTDEPDPDADERQGDGERSGKDSDTEDRRQRQRGPSASDKVNAILNRRPALRRRVCDADVATRKAAKAELAEAAGVSVRAVERALAGVKS